MHGPINIRFRNIIKNEVMTTEFNIRVNPKINENFLLRPRKGKEHTGGAQRVIM